MKRNPRWETGYHFGLLMSLKCKGKHPLSGGYNWSNFKWIAHMILGKMHMKRRWQTEGMVAILFFKVHLDFMNTHTTCITYPSNCEGKWIQCFNEIQDGGIAVTLNVYGQLLQSPDFLWIIPSIAQFLRDACGKVGNADQQGFWLVSWASDKDKDKDVPIDPMRRLKLLYITGNFQSWIFLSAIFNFSSLY